MKLTIKEVARIKDGSYGQFVLTGKRSGLITVSRTLNKLLAEYAATALHELLHFYFALLRLKGYKISDRKEHKAVYAAEKLVIKAMRKHCRG